MGFLIYFNFKASYVYFKMFKQFIILNYVTRFIYTIQIYDKNTEKV